MLENQGTETLIGRSFHGYRVTRFIAQGRMGLVFAGVQESLPRPVAIKFLSPHLSGDPAFRERFEREARAVAKLARGFCVPDVRTGRLPRFYASVMAISTSLADKFRSANGVEAAF